MKVLSGRPRTRYRNGDSISLHTGCDSCSPSRINGVLCHEAGCPDAWKDYPRECSECGCDFFDRFPGMCPDCLEENYV